MSVGQKLTILGDRHGKIARAGLPLLVDHFGFVIFRQNPDQTFDVAEDLRLRGCPRLLWRLVVWISASRDEA